MAEPPLLLAALLTCETLYFLQQEKCLHIVEGLLHMKKKRKKKLLSQMWHYTVFK